MVSSLGKSAQVATRLAWQLEKAASKRLPRQLACIMTRAAGGCRQGRLGIPKGLPLTICCISLNAQGLHLDASAQPAKPAPAAAQKK